MLFNATMCEEDRADLREGRKEQLARDDGGRDSRIKKIQSETTVRENMGKTLWWLAMEARCKRMTPSTKLSNPQTPAAAGSNSICR